MNGSSMTTTTAFLHTDFSKEKIPVEVLVKWSLNLGFLGLGHSLGIEHKIPVTES